MANERKTENLVRKLLQEQGYSGDENIIIEEQLSDNPKIKKLLKNASKSGNGIGFPEFIITFVNDSSKIVLIEWVIPPKRAASKSRINTSPAFSAGRVSLLKPSYAFALE